MIPPHERRILEAHIRGVPLGRLSLAEIERPLNEYEQKELKSLIKMRMRGIPLQYLIGNQEFYGRLFYVNTGVLIPRPETEGLVELALKTLPERNWEPGQKLLGLDLGTGSACIALTLALERPDLKMFASECSGEAFAVAEENIARFKTLNIELLRVSETPQLWQYDDLPALDLLISNPPYLLSDEAIAEDVRAHEPPEALFAPAGDPLLFYRFLAELLRAKIKPDGFGVFEIDDARGKETTQLFEEAGFKTTLSQDLAGRDRYVLVRASNG